MEYVQYQVAGWFFEWRYRVIMLLCVTIGKCLIWFLEKMTIVWFVWHSTKVFMCKMICFKTLLKICIRIIQKKNLHEDDGTRTDLWDNQTENLKNMETKQKDNIMMREKIYMTEREKYDRLLFSLQFAKEW